MDLYILVYLLSNIFLAHIINKFMYLFYEKCRVNKYIEFFIYSAYFVLITLVFLNFGNPIITTVFNMVSIFVFTLMYDYIDFKKNIFVTFIVYLILCSIELSIVAIVSFNNYSDAKYLNILEFIVTIVIYIFIYFLIYIKNINFKRINIIFSNKYFLFFCILPIISMILITINFFVISDSILPIVIVNFSILFLNIFVFKYCDLILRNVCEKILNKILKDKINGYKKEIKFFQSRNDFKKYINSNNNVVDDILNFKIDDIDDDTKLRLDILIEENLNISSNDLLIIIGSLMDNAISGVKSTFKNKDKYIDIKIKYLKGTVIINIKNSFNEKILVKNEGLFNRKGKFEDYGLGLLSVKKIIEKYNGVLDVKFNKNKFETYILIYDIKV